MKQEKYLDTKCDWICLGRLETFLHWIELCNLCREWLPSWQNPSLCLGSEAIGLHMLPLSLAWNT